eukprot:3493665-Pleurochrysis_carterae.AAC.1
MTGPGGLCPLAPSYPQLSCCRGWVWMRERGADGRGVLPGMITYVSRAHYPIHTAWRAAKRARYEPAQ